MHAPTRISYGEVLSGCRLNLPKLLISFGILAHDVPLHPLDPTAGTRQRNQHGVRHRQSIDYIWLCPCASRPRTQDPPGRARRATTTADFVSRDDKQAALDEAAFSLDD